MFFGGECFFRQIDTLAMTLCVAKELPDDEWDRYVVAGHTLAKKYGQPTKVALAMFAEAHPSAHQRGKLTTYLNAHHVPQLVRIAVLTDSAIIRGILTALGWALPRTTMRAFEVDALTDCLKWLHEGAPFDRAKAAIAWAEGRRLVGIDA
jgi:DNA-binding transcriptional LysR family regulator